MPASVIQIASSSNPNNQQLVGWNDSMNSAIGGNEDYVRILGYYINEVETPEASDKMVDMAAQWLLEVRDSGKLSSRYIRSLPENKKKKVSIESVEPGEWFMCDIGPGPFLKIQNVKNAIKVYDGNTRSFITLGKILRVNVVNMELGVQQ